MSKKRKRRLPEPVTFKQIVVCFSAHTVTIDGAKYAIDSDCFAMPILSSDSVYLTRGVERVG